MDILRFPGLGLEFPVDRVAISIGNFNIYWYGIIIAVAFAMGLWVYLSHNRRCGIHPDEGLDVILWAMLGAIVGARAYYVAYRWENYRDNLAEIFNLRGGGLAIYGGIIGAVLVAFIVCRIKKLPMLPVMDAAFPGVLLGQAIGRWGNFFNMEAFGCNTTLPWGMTSAPIADYLSRHQAELYAQGIAVDPSLPVHPTFLYESVWSLIGVAILLLWMFPRRSYDGQIALGYMAWYGLGRFFIEGLRTDSLMWGPVRVSQALGGILFLLGTALLIYFHSLGKKPMTLEYIEGQKKPRITLGRYVDTQQSRDCIAEGDARAAAKSKKNSQAKQETKEQQNEREDH